MTSLSSHFLLSEFVKSQTALRLRIDNTPSDEVVKNLRNLCVEVLEPVRGYYGIPFTPSSGYRCLELNKAIGGSSTSQHTKGYAADFEVPGISNKEVYRWMENNCEFDQLILEFYVEGEPNSGWLHCSYVNKDRNRKQAFPHNR